MSLVRGKTDVPDLKLEEVPRTDHDQQALRARKKDVHAAGVIDEPQALPLIVIIVTREADDDHVRLVTLKRVDRVREPLLNISLAAVESLFESKAAAVSARKF